MNSIHDSGLVSGAECFIIVSLPDDAADTICRSMELLIFAERFYQLRCDEETLRAGEI